MTARFDGQVAIVTGASGGMGARVALAFRGHRRVRRGGRPHGGRREGDGRADRAGGRSGGLRADRRVRRRRCGGPGRPRHERLRPPRLRRERGRHRGGAGAAARGRGRGLRPHHRGQPALDLPLHEARDRGHAGRRARRSHRQHRLDQLVPPTTAPVGLHRQQARRAGDDPQRRGRLRRRGHPHQRHLPGRHRHADAASGDGAEGPASRRRSRAASASWAASGSPTRSPRPACGCARTSRRSRPATRWPSTAATSPADGRARAARSQDRVAGRGRTTAGQPASARSSSPSASIGSVTWIAVQPAARAPVTFGPKSSRKMIRDDSTPRRSAVRS